jgi:hypothetical protein
MGISGLDTSGSRLTCGFVFSGEPNPDAAKSLGLLKP